MCDYVTWLSPVESSFFVSIASQETWALWFAKKNFVRIACIGRIWSMYGGSWSLSGIRGSDEVMRGSDGRRASLMYIARSCTSCIYESNVFLARILLQVLPKKDNPPFKLQNAYTFGSFFLSGVEYLQPRGSYPFTPDSKIHLSSFCICHMPAASRSQLNTC